MKLRWIDSDGVSGHDLAELPDLRKRTDGFLWLDIPEWSDDAGAILANEFHFHPMAIAKSKDRNHIPRVHVYPHHVFIVVHAPEIGARGHMHYLELDQFVGEDFLVTVHGPLNPKVSLESALRETPEGRALMQDVLDQYETVAHISDSQLVFLMGVTEFYRARTDTKMTIAAERLAVIAAITLPITSLSSVVGMNVIVNESTRWVPLAILLLIMLVISLILLRWAHKQGWW